MKPRKLQSIEVIVQAGSVPLEGILALPDPGKLERVAELARGWFQRHLAGS